MKQSHFTPVFSVKKIVLVVIIIFISMLKIGQVYAQEVTAVCKNITVQLDSNGVASIFADDIDNGSFGTNGIFSKEIDKDSFTCSDIGSNTVTLSVIGNFFFGDQCIATVTVVESTSSLNCAISASFQSNSCLGYTVSNNSLNPSITEGSCSSLISLVNNFTGSDSLNGAAFPLGTTNVEWTANFGNGNIISCQQEITVTNSAVPVITLVGSIVQTLEACLNYDELGATAQSSCGIDISSQITIDDSQVNMSVVGTYIVYYNVIDNGQAAVQQARTISVIDSIDPILNCPSPPAPYNLNLGECDYEITDTSLDPISVSDNCVISSIINSYNNSPTLSGAVFPSGSTTVVWTVTDVNNRTSTCQYDVVVNEGSGVSLQSCPNDVNAITDSGLCYYFYDPEEPTFSGVCPSTTITWEMTGATSATGVNTIGATNFNIGETIITYSVGNFVTCSFSIFIEDYQAPIISNFPTNRTVYTSDDGLGNCSTTVTWVEPSVLDNCTNGLVWTKSHNSGDIFSTGTTIVTYQTQDASGNIVSAAFNITVIDDEEPLGSPLLDVVTPCELTFSTIPTRTDNCGGVISGTTGDYTFPHTFSVKGIYPIVWEFDDGTNKFYETQNIIIEDNEAPVLNNLVLPNITEGCELGFIIPPTATDNCFASGNSFSATTTTPFPITTFGTTIVEWIFDDGNGNITIQYQNVTLNATPVLGGELLGVMENVFDSNGDPMSPTHSIPISDCHDSSNSITIDLTGYTGDIIHWEKFEEGGNAWSVIPMIVDSHTIDFTFSSSKSTLFRVLISSGTCYQYSTIFNVHSIPPDVPPILDEDLFNICLNEGVHLAAHSGYLDYVDLEEDEGGKFNIGQFPNKWDPTQWKIDGQVAGSEWTAAGNNTSVNNWSGTNNHPVGTNYKIEYDSNDFKFGIAHGDFTSQEYIDDFGGDPTTLETPIFSLFGLISASIDFDQAYNLHAGDIAKLELSIDGGVTYDITLQDLVGTSPEANSWGPVPYPYQAPKPDNSTTTYFNFEDDNTSYDISDYIGFDNVRVRWTFYGTTDESTWAIDNISLPLAGADSNKIEWTEGIGEPGYYIVRGELNVTYDFVPEAPGYHQYGATTLINDCRSYDSEGTALADVYVNYSYAGEDMIYTNAECGNNEVELNAYDNTITANENVAKGAFVAPDGCETCDDQGTMAQGEWAQVVTNTCGIGQFLSEDPTLYPNPANDPNATFIGEAGLYTLTWTVNGCIDTVLVDIKNCSVVDFDGIDDHIDLKKQNYDLDGAFSLEMWIKPSAISVTIQTLFSKRDANNLIDGYDLRLVNNTISFNWNNGSLSSPHPISNDRWYHIAVTHSSSNYILYIDGIEVNSVSGSAPNINDFKTIVGAMDIDKSISKEPINYFNGWIDELRIWNTTLNVEQIHQMMNQEIKLDPTGTNVFGEIIPIDIYGLPWTSLEGYYRMDDISCGYLNPTFGVGTNGKLKNIQSAQEETAPLPYISANNGDWENINSWLRPSVWNTPNSVGVDGTTDIDWNIVQTNNNINSGDKNITVLGLISNSGELTIMEPGIENEKNPGRMLWVTHYLKLDGSIDLVGDSQLIQKPYWPAQYYESILEESSIGFVERDQQGIMNSYSYNYWSSPVSKMGIGNNKGVYINEILKDGTISTNPIDIDFGLEKGYYHADGALTSPIKIATAWIWKFVNDTNAYAQWEFLGDDDGLLNPTEGYTMKGVDGGGTLDLNEERQNYVFKGKPNNTPFGIAGTPLIHTTFDIPVDPNYPNISLTGNPFPSALDADQFIIDNLNSTNGTLYFWEHWSNNTHKWALYQGGYATRKVNNGVPAVTHSGVSTGGSARSIPGAYVSVGQGFYVVSSATGGDVVFKNSQRVFERESENGGTSSVFIKGQKEKNKTNINNKGYDDTMRIRLGCESPDGFHRQILASFFEGPTDDVDYLYDGKAGDGLANDAFFLQNDEYFVIQAFGEFNKDREIPIVVIIEENQNGGIQKFMIDELENIPDDNDIYIKDYSNGETYNISNGSSFEISLESGEHKDRFAMVFQSKLDTLDDVLAIGDLVTIFMNNTLREINIQKTTELDFKEVTLLNSLGQVVQVWQNGLNEREIKLAVNELPIGIYIVKIETVQGAVSKKIIIE